MKGLAGDFLNHIADNTKGTFEAQQTIMSFESYLEEVLLKPRIHLRNCAIYFADMIDRFSSYERHLPTGKCTRYRLFDMEFCQKEGKIMGQEQVQNAVVKLIQTFVHAGKVDKLILLHGPNGAAKTSLVQAFTKAAEVYSTTDEGAMYQFNWIFPKKEAFSGTIGFQRDNINEEHSFALLPNDLLDASIPSEQRDHPLLLLSLKERQKLFETLKKNPELPADYMIPEVLRLGDLSQKNRKIFDALLIAYHGDLKKVFRHIQIERFYLSRRYHVGISVVEPQLSVDAQLRQMTADQSFHSLPVSLRHLALIEAQGPLAEANRGIIEYSDLLKRPIDAWKYLLVATEQAQASVGIISLFFDLLMVATSNELHLVGFREYPDWQSFKGRIELVRVPYLLRSSDETEIYKNQIPKALSGVQIARHCLEVVAQWGVLTRLEPPDPQKYAPEVRDLILSLTPAEKMALYDSGNMPERLSQKEARELRGLIKKLYQEFHDESNYEGRYGASPREIRMMLLNAAQNPRFDHLAVSAVFEQIEDLIEQRASYDFLRREPLRGFRDAKGLLETVKKLYRSSIEDEIITAIGLYKKNSHIDLFSRYILHLSAWIKKERFFDSTTGRHIEADLGLMNGVEKAFLAKSESAEDFRRALITQIGAYRLEHPDQEVIYADLFPSYLRRLKESFYAEQMNTVNRILSLYLQSCSGEKPVAEEKDIHAVEVLRDGLFQIGYTPSSAYCAVAFLADEKKKNNVSHLG